MALIEFIGFLTNNDRCQNIFLPYILSGYLQVEESSNEETKKETITFCNILRTALKLQMCYATGLKLQAPMEVLHIFSDPSNVFSILKF